MLNNSIPPAESRAITLWGDESPKIRDMLVIVVVLYCFVLGTMALFIDIRVGYYGVKLPLMFLITLFLFRVKYYSFLVGLLIPCYFLIKSPGAHGSDATLLLSYSHVMVFMMALFLVFSGKKQLYKVGMDVPFIMFVFILLFVSVGSLFVKNWYLFLGRYVEIIGFFSAYIVGSRFNTSLIYESKLLLLGLGAGLVSFSLPFTLGIAVRRGVEMTSSLDTTLNDVGAASSSIEAGIALIIFAFSFSVFNLVVNKNIRKYALIVSTISALTCFFFVSKGATISMLAVILFLIWFGFNKDKLSHHRAIHLLILLGVVSTFLVVLLFFLPGLYDSLYTRLLRVDGTFLGRLEIWAMVGEVSSEYFSLGVGGGQFRFYTKIWHAHNEFLNILVEHGQVSFILYLLIYFYFIYIAIKLFRLGGEFRTVATIYGAVIVAYTLYGQIEPMYFSRAGLLFMFISGWLVSSFRSRSSYSGSDSVAFAPNCLREKMF